MPPAFPCLGHTPSRPAPVSGLSFYSPPPLLRFLVLPVLLSLAGCTGGGEVPSLGDQEYALYSLTLDTLLAVFPHSDPVAVVDSVPAPAHDKVAFVATDPHVEHSEFALDLSRLKTSTRLYSTTRAEAYSVADSNEFDWVQLSTVAYEPDSSRVSVHFVFYCNAWCGGVGSALYDRRGAEWELTDLSYTVP